MQTKQEMRNLQKDFFSMKIIKQCDQGPISCRRSCKKSLLKCATKYGSSSPLSKHGHTASLLTTNYPHFILNKLASFKKRSQERSASLFSNSL